MGYTYAQGSIHVPIGPRAAIREQLVTEFLKEQPGTGKGAAASRFEYEVDQLSNGDRVFLRRPAPKNNGMDFIVRIENLVISNKKRLVDVPSHNDALVDLDAKVLAEPARKSVICSAIGEVFSCTPITTHLRTTSSHGSFTEEQLVMSFKWMFIEQDVTYWNKSGRNMLMDEIHSRGLC